MNTLSRSFLGELGISNSDIGAIMAPVDTEVMANTMMWQFITVGAGYVNCPEPSPQNIVETCECVLVTTIATRPSVVSGIMYDSELCDIVHKSNVNKLIFFGGISVKKLMTEAFDFAKTVYEEKFIDPGKQTDIWFDNYLPVLYVLYLKYIEHFYNEIDHSDIDALCDIFGSAFGGEDVIPDSLAQVVAHMKTTNKELDKIIPQLRQIGASFNDAWAMCFYYLYRKDVNTDGVMKLQSIAEKISSSRTDVDPRVEKNADVFIETAYKIAGIVKKLSLKNIID